MKVLLTGHRGFVGRHLHRAFEDRGDTVHGIDILDGHDALDFFRAPRKNGFDLAVHCAAVIGGRTGIDGTPLAVATNLALDTWFFRWLQQSGTLRAAYFSSSAAYPVDLQSDFARPHRLRERDIATGRRANIGRPDATYGWTKLTGEQLAEHARADGHQVLVARPFSGFGSDQSTDYPFPSFIRRAAQREDPFEIWGDGRQVRDWVHISDVVGAVMALLDAGEEGPVNIGTGRATAFDELAELVIAAVGNGYRPEIKHLSGQPTGVAYRVADPTLLHQHYQPRVSLEEGIRRALAEAHKTAR